MTPVCWVRGGCCVQAANPGKMWPRVLWTVLLRSSASWFPGSPTVTGLLDGTCKIETAACNGGRFNGMALAWA